MCHLLWTVGGPAVSAWVAEERNRVLGGELTEGKERAQADLLGKAKDGELGAWWQFKVPPPEKIGAQTKDVVDTRRALTWKEAGGKKAAAARQGAKGCQDPDLRDGNVDVAGRAGGRSSQLQSISRGACRGWKIWSLDIKSALSLANGFGREVLLQAPGGWGPGNILAAIRNQGRRRLGLMMPRLDKYLVLA